VRPNFTLNFGLRYAYYTPLREAANRIVKFNIETLLRPFAEIDYKTSGGHDSYNSLQLSLSRRSARGLSTNAQYAIGYSKGNTGGSNEATTAGNNARAITDFDYDDGYNNFDVRHTFNLSQLLGDNFGAKRQRPGIAPGRVFHG